MCIYTYISTNKKIPALNYSQVKEYITIIVIETMRGTEKERGKKFSKFS